MFLPHPADPTLTTDNLMEVVKEVEYRWEELREELRVRTLSRVQGMADVVNAYICKMLSRSLLEAGCCCTGENEAGRTGR